MHSQPPKGALGRTSPSRLQESTDTSSGKTTGTSGRGRSNTRNRVQPPAIHLSLKAGSSAISSDQEDPQTPKTGSPGAKTSDTPSSGGYSSRSGYSSKGFSLSPSYAGKYGTHITSSPLAESLSPFTSGSEYLSNSLPTTMSPLSKDTGFDLELPSPASSRPPTRDKPSSPLHKSSGLNTLHPPASRVTSSSGSRKSSTASLDRDAPLHLDMKRLLSKPALPTHSGSSIISVPSDLDGSSASPSPRHPRSFAELSKRSPRRIDSGSMVDGGVSPSPLRTLRESASRTSLRLVAHEAESKPAIKSRNVLRRKPSSRSNPATPTTTTFHAATEGPNTTIRRTAPISGPRPLVPRRAASATAQPVSVDRVRRKEKPPPGLTPAGAVVHAYKQQEQRREELAEISGWNDQLRQEKSVRSVEGLLRGHDKEDGEGGGGGVYYSVFGSSTGRLVAVGSKEDRSWDLDYVGRMEHEERIRLAGKQTAAASGSVSGVRTLSRKVSGRFKKAAGSVRRDLDGSPHSTRRISESTHEDWAPYDGRPSIQAGASKRSFATDEYIDVVQRQGSTDSTIPSAPNGRSEKTNKDARALRSMRSFKGKDKEAEKEQHGDSSPSGKLWKLVKRISTGALKDKYVRDSIAPPVPALPKDLQHQALSRNTLEIRKSSGRESPVGLNVSRFLQSRSSMSAVRPSTAPHKGSPRTEHPPSRPSTGARPSTTTRSSSPMSSDMASSRFFHKTHSVRSSISSYGEELPPLPQVNVGHHIMSPSELYKLNHDGQEDPSEKSTKRNRTRSQSAAATTPSRTSDLPPPSLPPPRRSNTAGSASNKVAHANSPPSPTIPAFTTTDPVNNFSLASRLSLPTSEFGVLSESIPPRPPRSSRRKPVPSELVSPTASTPVSPPMPRTPRSPNVPSISVDASRSSILSHSSGKETIQSATASTIQLRSPLRFRELDSPRCALTEQEKAAKWDDLLERSDRAGGTLHLGESGLMSDNVRFSEYSGMSDIP